MKGMAVVALAVLTVTAPPGVAGQAVPYHAATPQQAANLLARHLGQALGGEVAGRPVAWVVGIDISRSTKDYGTLDVCGEALQLLLQYTMVGGDSLHIIPFDQVVDPPLDAETETGAQFPRGFELASASVTGSRHAITKDLQQLLVPRAQPLGSAIDQGLAAALARTGQVAEEEPGRKAVCLLLSDRPNNDAVHAIGQLAVPGVRCPGVARRQGHAPACGGFLLTVSGKRGEIPVQVYYATADRTPPAAGSPRQRQAHARQRLVPPASGQISSHRPPGVKILLVVFLVAWVVAVVLAFAAAREVELAWAGEAARVRLGDKLRLTLSGAHSRLVGEELLVALDGPGMTPEMRAQFVQARSHIGTARVHFDRLELATEGGYQARGDATRLARDGGERELHLEHEEDGQVLTIAERLRVGFRSARPEWRKLAVTALVCLVAWLALLGIPAQPVVTYFAR